MRGSASAFCSPKKKAELDSQYSSVAWGTKTVLDNRIGSMGRSMTALNVGLRWAAVAWQATGRGSSQGARGVSEWPSHRLGGTPAHTCA